MQSILRAIKNGASFDEILDKMRKIYPELEKYSAEELKQIQVITSILY